MMSEDSSEAGTDNRDPPKPVTPFVHTRPVNSEEFERIFDELDSELKDQLQERDETIRNLESQFNVSRMLKIGSPVGSLDKNALETKITQLKDNITSLGIQNDG
nr:hypothetical protein [Tanacetum cinerariifolium]